MSRGKIISGYIHLSGGKIKNIKEGQPENNNNIIYFDANGGFITPGLIDLHSHGGLYSFPTDGSGNSDTNEMTNPTFSAVRVIDAFNPHDEMLHDVISSGVTTLQVLPGSGNVIGGQGLAVKLKGNTTEEMRIKNTPIYMKMACGENPKNTYGRKGVTPMSRLGNAYKLRKILSDAQQLYQQQLDFCEGRSSLKAFPKDIYLQPMVDLLRGKVSLNIHCYKTGDFEMALRVMDEFGVNISAFHHAAEAHTVSKELSKREIGVAIFSDNWAVKLEAYNFSVHNPRILDENNVSVILKTDHPIIHGRDLLYQAQKAAHWGLNPDSALEAITLKPAIAMKLEDRIGSLSIGKDADIVVWDRHPLHLGAKPIYIFIEGHLVKQNNLDVRKDLLSYKSPFRSWKMVSSPSNICESISDNSNTLNSYAIINANIYTGSTYLPNSIAVIKNGIYECVGNCNTTNIDVIFDLKNGTMTPGLIMNGMLFGTKEVDQESSWQNGKMAEGINGNPLAAVSLETSHVRASWKDGVLTAISNPDSNKVFSGSSSAFNIGPGIKVLDKTYIINQITSVDIKIGNRAKSDISSISDQIQNIKIQFNKTLHSNEDTVLKRAINGELPIVFWVNSADYILSILRVLDEVFGDPNSYNMKIAFAEAAEGYLVSEHIKRWNAYVLMRRCYREGFETRRCNFDKAVQTLKKAGIKIGILPQEKNSAKRGLRWEAGYAKEAGLSLEEAIATVTSNMAE